MRLCSNDLPENWEACSRAQSRTAREIVQQQVLTLVQANGGVMDDACPFHSKLDMYFDQETYGKQVNYRGQWLCTYSKKLFRGERYVDLHLDRFWGSRLRGGEAAVCLADWCDVLGCNKKVGGNHVAPHDGQDRYHEHRCRAVVHSCFPPSLDERNKKCNANNFLCDTE